MAVLSNSPKGRVPRALPVGEWVLAHRASSIACVLERVPRAMPVGIYGYLDRKLPEKDRKELMDCLKKQAKQLMELRKSGHLSARQ